MKRLICFFGILAAAASADDPESVQAKIVRAMSAGPADIAKSARIVDTNARGRMVVLREEKNDFTCMPGNPNVIGDPPMCADAASMRWAADFKAHKPKPTSTAPELPRSSGGLSFDSDRPVQYGGPPLDKSGPKWAGIGGFRLQALTSNSLAKIAVNSWDGFDVTYDAVTDPTALFMRNKIEESFGSISTKLPQEIRWSVSGAHSKVRSP